MNLIKYMLLLAIALMLFSIMQFSYADPPLPVPVGRVVWVKGDSFKAIMPNKEERLLKKTSLIFLNDKLVTDDKTQAEIVFTDNTLITFHTNTTFVVDEYSYKPKDKGSVGKSVMSVIEGGFRTVTGLIAKQNPPDYKVNTPVATIGVRGTDYTVRIKNGEVFIGFAQGQPCIKSKAGGNELCLDKTTPYARVKDATSAPEGMTTRPDALGEELEVTPAKIAGFGTTGKTGTVSSFCIGT